MKTTAPFKPQPRLTPLLTALAFLFASPVFHATGSDRSQQGGVRNQVGAPSLSPKDAAPVAVPKLPPVPEGTTELKFSEFFIKPVGSRGLELSPKLRGLHGKRVRILGYMAHREVQPAGMFLLTPFPVEVHDHDNSLAEDFPASAVQVRVPHLSAQNVPHARGLMLLTGTLSIGNQAEEDGRISLVRLDLDPPAQGNESTPVGPK